VPGPNRTVCAGSFPTTSVCCNGVCCDGCCGQGGACGACLVFVTSATTPNGGNLGGLLGADDICQDLADSVTPDPLPGTYMAWLSDANGSPTTHFRQSQRPYVRTDGLAVADDWADLIDPPLIRPIDRTELNTEESDSINVWTNTTSTGAAASTDFDCNDWTSDDGVSDIGRAGSSNQTDDNWTLTGLSPFCNNPFTRLYCFQQT
jgi:hypothetical protein